MRITPHSSRFKLVMLCVLFLPSTLSYASPQEYALKAAFIEKFSRFINWPHDSPVHEPDTVFNICVIGKNPFNGVLKKVVSLSTIKNKSALVKQINTIGKISGCQILYISSTENNTLIKILNQTYDKPILTISDTPGYSKYGVIINFYPRKNSIGFQINKRASEQSRLSISSRLLKLSRIVESHGDKP